MNTSLNFIFLNDTLTANGDGLFGTSGPFFNYIQKENFQYSLSGKIKDGCKNILPIEISKGGMGIKEIPNEIFDFVNTNDIKLLIINLADPTAKNQYIQCLNYLKDRHLDFDKLIYVDSNLQLSKLKTNFTNKIYTFNYFIEEATWTKDGFYDTNNDLGYVSKRIEESELDNFRSKKFLCFNRNIDRAHRFILLYEYIKGVFHDSYFSFLRPIDYFKENQHFIEDYNQTILTEEDIDFYNQKLPIELDTQSTEKKHGFAVTNTLKKDLFLDSCIHLVTETKYIDNELFLSEKILKPILGYQPFIVFGPHGYLKELKKYGFKTFSNIWDESYDDIKDPVERMKSLISLVKQLNNKSIEELNDIYRSTKDICIYNRNVFYSLEIDTLKVIFEEIENEW